MKFQCLCRHIVNHSLRDVDACSANAVAKFHGVIDLVDGQTVFSLSIHDPLAAAAVEAERAFLACLGGGFSLPIAAFAQKNNVTIILTDAVISLDGKQAIRLRDVDQDPHRLGERLATVVLERGAAELLKAKA